MERFIEIITLLIPVALLVHILSINPSSKDVWNNGRCAECDKRFVVVEASGSINLYACPECDKEVKRVTW